MSLPPVTPAKDHVNRVIRDTILAVEDELNTLSKLGKAKDKSPAIVGATVRELPDEDDSDETPFDRTNQWVKKCTIQDTKKKNEKEKSSSSKGKKPAPISSDIKITPGSTVVTPTKDGVMVKLTVNMATRNGDRVMEMTIDCPRFEPKRIHFDGEWRNLV